jgi:beta-glucosidase
MHGSLITAISGAAALAGTAAAQQPYKNWEAAYQAANKLISSWTIEQRSNISVRNGAAPGYIPFTTTDGK